MNGKIVKKWAVPGVIVLVAIIISAVTFVYASGNLGVKTSGNTGTVPNGSTELYMFVAPNDNPENLMTKVLDNGQNITYNQPGSTFNFTMNTTIDIATFIVNHQNRDMNYYIMVFQALPDSENNTFNFTQLYYNGIDTIPDKSARQVVVHVNPAYTANDTRIGVVLLDGSGSNAIILNTTDIIADVV